VLNPDPMATTDTPAPELAQPDSGTRVRHLSFGRPILKGTAAFKRLFQQGELWFILLAASIGALAGLLSAALSRTAFRLQQYLYNFDPDQHLSALSRIEPWRLLALPLGGLILGLYVWLMPKKASPPIDVIEANALYGGRIPLKDSLRVTFQTLISNGFGASVGLEAAYAQMGGGVASRIGQWLDLKRNALRTLVGAGAGAAIGAAFGAPLMGSFYAFEIVLGGYTPASLAPVAVAALMGVLVARFAGEPPFVVVSTIGNDIDVSGYALYAVLGLLCAGAGIGIIRLVAVAEASVRRLPIHEAARPVIGGIILMGLAVISPQALSAGHGALHLDLAQRLSIGVLLWIFTLKLCASVVSLGFGFRGGLFFASLFLGSLLGSTFAQIVNLLPGLPTLDTTNAALVGMAALAVAVVGGPMCMSLMVLEVTHDFALTAAVVIAALCSNALVRAQFGYSFSTWRLHLRGESVRNARDIGWTRSLTAGRLMRRDIVSLPLEARVSDLRARVALGSTSRVMLIHQDKRYAGMVITARAYMDGLAGDVPLKSLSQQADVFATPEMSISDLIALFDAHNADDLAVVSKEGLLIGQVGERYIRRRYVEELEKAQREFFGET
jgi:chloride channel protein, CIC family